MISEELNETFAVVALSPSISHDNLDQSKYDLTSAPFATPKESKFSPVRVSAPVLPSYFALPIVVVGKVVSITRLALSERLFPLGIAVVLISFP